MKRILLFLATNIAILLVLSIVLRLFGVERILDEQGANLDLTALLAFAAIIGMGVPSCRWRCQVDGQTLHRRARDRAAPQRNRNWLVQTVRRQAQGAGIGMPEVAIYDSPDVNAFATGARRNAALLPSAPACSTR